MSKDIKKFLISMIVLIVIVGIIVLVVNLSKEETSDYDYTRSCIYLDDLPDEASGFVNIFRSTKEWVDYNPDFTRYTLEYKTGKEPETWILINASSELINETLLGVLNTSLIDDGYCTIKLIVECSDGTFIDTEAFIINNEYSFFTVDNSSSKKGDFNSIQDAIDSAGNGDEIFVYNGKYYENLNIHRAINLTGENRESTIIMPTDVDDDTIDIYSINGVSINQFTIYSEGIESIRPGEIIDVHGIKIQNSNNNNIIDNNIYNSSYGIHTYHSDNNLISGNKIMNGYGGICCASDNTTITNNIIIHNQELGISLTGDNITITYNNISSNEAQGIQGYSNNNCIIYKNIISGSRYGIWYDGDYGYFIGETGNIIYHNNFFNNYFDALSFTNNTWYNPDLKEGNYWDDYIGLDEDDNGVGDTLFIPENMNEYDNPTPEDPYPLMNPVEI